MNFGGRGLRWNRRHGESGSFVHNAGTLPAAGANEIRPEAGSPRSRVSVEAAADDFQEFLGAVGFLQEVPAGAQLGFLAGDLAAVTAGKYDFQGGFVGQQLFRQLTPAQPIGHDEVGE